MHAKIMDFHVYTYCIPEKQSFGSFILPPLSVLFVCHMLDELVSAHLLQFQNGQFTSSISHSIFQEFRQLLDDKIGVLVKLKDLIIDWVQEGFQEFFRALDNRFLLLSGRNNSSSPVQGLEGTQGDKVLVGLVLVLAQLSVFIEQTAIPRITEARNHLLVLCYFFSERID